MVAGMIVNRVRAFHKNDDHATKLSSMEGRAKFGDYETWYRVTGDIDAKKPPLFILHGGPGAAHNYVDAYKLLATEGRAVIHYDQLGLRQLNLST